MQPPPAVAVLAVALTLADLLCRVPIPLHETCKVLHPLHVKRLVKRVVVVHLFATPRPHVGVCAVRSDGRQPCRSIASVHAILTLLARTLIAALAARYVAVLLDNRCTRHRVRVAATFHRLRRAVKHSRLVIGEVAGTAISAEFRITHSHVVLLSRPRVAFALHIAQGSLALKVVRAARWDPWTAATFCDPAGVKHLADGTVPTNTGSKCVRYLENELWWGLRVCLRCRRSGNSCRVAHHGAPSARVALGKGRGRVGARRGTAILTAAAGFAVRRNSRSTGARRWCAGLLNKLPGACML